MKCSLWRPRGWLACAPSLNIAALRPSFLLVYCGICPFLPCAHRLKQTPVLESGSVRHTSTNLFVVWKSSAGLFPRTPYSALLLAPLSSAALVTATQAVQHHFAIRFPLAAGGFSVTKTSMKFNSDSGNSDEVQCCHPEPSRGTLRQAQGRPCFCFPST
jgi:hypothetical protein